MNMLIANKRINNVLEIIRFKILQNETLFSKNISIDFNNSKTIIKLLETISSILITK